MEWNRGFANERERTQSYLGKRGGFARKSVLWLLLLVLAASCLPPSACAAEVLSDEALLALYDQVEDQDRDVEDRYRIPVEKDDLSLQEGLSEEWRNILLLGTDTGGKLNYGRTDAMIILSIHTQTGAVKMASLARDMWVDIPGLSLPNRINAANAFGGPYLAMKTVNAALNMNIREYCSINFSGLEKVVDLLGGVSLEITKEEAGIVGARVQKGVALLNGEQALAYARIRKLDSNFGRNERQRKLLEALFHTILQTRDAKQLFTILSGALPHLATNLELGDMFTLLAAAMKTKALSLETLSLPQTGDFHYDAADGKSKIIFDQDATVSALHAFIYGKDAPQDGAEAP